MGRRCLSDEQSDRCGPLAVDDGAAVRVEHLAVGTNTPSPCRQCGLDREVWRRMQLCTRWDRAAHLSVEVGGVSRGQEHVSRSALEGLTHTLVRRDSAHQ